MGSEKDRERARYWFGDERTTARDVSDLAEQFASARYEERRAIVAWLLRRSDLGDGSGSLYGAASAIEAGEHHTPAKGEGT